MFLLAHSFGGLVVRRFALLYPEDVAGIVLVDPMRCEEWPPLDPTKQATLDRGIPIDRLCDSHRWLWPRLSQGDVPAVPLCRLSGFLSRRRRRWRHSMYLAASRAKSAKCPKKSGLWYGCTWSRPSYYRGMCSHVEAVPDTVREMQNADPILGIPVTLLTPAQTSPLSEQSLNRIGDHVQQIIAPASAHWIHLDQPDLVIDSIRQMVTASAPEPVPVTV